MLVVGFVAAGCGASGPGPVTVTGIPYGTITVANLKVGSYFRCKGGQSMRITSGGGEGYSAPDGKGGGIGDRRRHGKALVYCTRS